MPSHRAFTLDQRGHGDSAWVKDKGYAFDDYASDAVAVCRSIVAQTGKQPVLVGASLGGISGLMAEHLGGPKLLAGLVLVDITPHMDADGVSRIQGFMAERMREGFATLEEAAEAIAAYLPNRAPRRSLDGLAKNLRQGEDGRYRWHWDPAFIDGPRTINHGAETGQQRLVDAARGLTIPVLLVRGQQSELVTEEAVNAFRAMVPHADFADVSGAGHMVAAATAMMPSMTRFQASLTSLKDGCEPSFAFESCFSPGHEGAAAFSIVLAVEGGGGKGRCVVMILA